MACSTGTPAKDHNTQLLNRIFKLNRQDKLVGENVLPLRFMRGNWGRENGLSQVIAKGCDQSGVQIQTRCLQCGPDGLEALPLCRFYLQLECVIQVCCAAQSMREIPPDGGSFLSPPSHPTPPPEMGSSSITSCASDEDKPHPAPSLGLTFTWLVLAGSQITGCACCDAVCWGAPGQVRGGRRKFTWIQS